MSARKSTQLPTIRSRGPCLDERYEGADHQRHAAVTHKRRQLVAQALAQMGGAEREGGRGAYRHNDAMIGKGGGGLGASAAARNAASCASGGRGGAPPCAATGWASPAGRPGTPRPGPAGALAGGAARARAGACCGRPENGRPGSCGVARDLGAVHNQRVDCGVWSTRDSRVPRQPYDKPGRRVPCAPMRSRSPQPAACCRLLLCRTLPPPVGMSTKTSRPESVALMMAPCCALRSGTGTGVGGAGRLGAC